MTAAGELTKCPRCGATAEQHPLNRCMDAWIADLLGWTDVGVERPWRDVDGRPPGDPQIKPVPHYHLDASEALVLADHCRDRLCCEVRIDIYSSKVVVRIDSRNHGPQLVGMHRIDCGQTSLAFSGAMATAALAALLVYGPQKREATA